MTVVSLLKLSLVLSCLGGLAALDLRAGWQSLVAEPIVVGLAVGGVLGTPLAGLSVGLFLQLLWLSMPPMRGAERPDQVAGAVAGAAASSYLATRVLEPQVEYMVALGVFLGLVAAMAGRALGRPLWDVRDRWLAGLGKAGPGYRGRIRRAYALGLGGIFLGEAVVVFPLVLASLAAAEPLAGLLGGGARGGVLFWYALLPAFGVASVINLFGQKNLIRSLAVTTFVGVLVLWLR